MAKWKALHLEVSRQLGMPFAEPHIEKWCNGWQVRAHFLPITNMNLTEIQPQFYR
ncbi:Glucose-6-phosphate 1-dehydrogenase [Actinobacillus equuli]|nr:Glucose-6-phosphate 1-dehydrogenase [Actinobacillus equuli]